MGASRVGLGGSACAVWQRACVGCGARRSQRQRRVRVGCGARRKRSPLRSDSPPMLGLPARGRTRYVCFAHCTQTAATSQMTKRAARAAESPALLGASHAPRNPPGHAFVAHMVARQGKDEHSDAHLAAVSLPSRRTAGGGRGGWHPGSAISGAVSSAGTGSAHAKRVLRQLTRRHCLSTVSEANGASLPTRPRAEQRSEVGAKRRPPPHEPTPGATRRDPRRLTRRNAHPDTRRVTHCASRRIAPATRCHAPRK
jgi:hypothetical protein